MLAQKPGFPQLKEIFVKMTITLGGGVNYLIVSLFVKSPLPIRTAICKYVVTPLSSSLAKRDNHQRSNNLGNISGECFYGDGIKHNEDIMHSFQNFIVRLIPNHPPPLETRIWKLVVRVLITTEKSIWPWLP